MTLGKCANSSPLSWSGPPLLASSGCASIVAGPGDSVRIFLIGALCATLGGCAYKAEPVAAPSYNVVTSFTKKVPGKWLLSTEAAALNQSVKPGGTACSAHTFPVELEGAFQTSTSETLRNVFEQVEDVPQPIPGDQVRRRGARGMIVVRGEEVRPRLDVQPGFWSANMRTQVMVVASVYVDGPSGRIFGQTVEGQRKR